MTTPTPKKRTPLDYNGRPITVDATVRQRNVYDRDGGAFQVNARMTGKVTETFVVKVAVDFGRNAFHGFRVTDDPAPPVLIRGVYLEVIDEGEQLNPGA